jgi:Concanavalin A-like lectin/glucanases superfamily
VRWLAAVFIAFSMLAGCARVVESKRSCEGKGAVASRTFAPANNAWLESPPSSVYDRLDEMTLAMWVKPSSLPPLDAGIASLLSKDPNNFEDAEFYIDNFTGFEGTFGGYRYGNANEGVVGESETAPGTITVGAWQHLAWTFKVTAGGTPVMYINGTPASPLTHDNTMPPASTVFDGTGTPWTIGNGFSSFDPHFEGEISDVRIFNAVLSAEQVASLKAGGSPLPENLVAWWKLSSTDPTFDSSGNGNSLIDYGTTEGTDEPSTNSCVSNENP